MDPVHNPIQERGVVRRPLSELATALSRQLPLYGTSCALVAAARPSGNATVVPGANLHRQLADDLREAGPTAKHESRRLEAGDTVQRGAVHDMVRVQPRE
jgi:hypothetical protein